MDLLMRLNFPKHLCASFAGTITGTALVSAIAVSHSFAPLALDFPEISAATFDPALSVSITAKTGQNPTGRAGYTFSVAATGFPALNLSTSANYDPTWSDVTYVWRFSEGGQFTNLTGVFDFQNDRSVARGPFVGRTFGEGTHTVTVRALTADGLRYNEATTTITVGNADTYFDGANTICVGTDFTGAPAGSQQVATIAAAITLGEARSKCRIMLRAGETFAESGLNLRNLPNVHVDSFGAGAKPVITQSLGDGDVFLNRFDYYFNDLANSPSDIIQNIDIQGPWNPNNSNVADHQEAASSGYNPAFNFEASFAHMAVYNVVSTGSETGILWLGSTGAEERGQHVIDDCSFVDYRKYGFDVNGWIFQDFALFGISAYRAADCYQGGLGRQGGNSQGPGRFSGGGRIYMGLCRTTSRSSWTALVGGYVVPQPGVRFEASPASVNVDRGIYVGGSVALKFGTVDGDMSNNGANMVADGVTMVASCASAAGVSAAIGGVHVRNCVFIIPDVDSLYGTGGNGYRGLVAALVENDAGKADSRAGGLAVYNNTIVLRNAEGAGNTNFATVFLSNQGDSIPYPTQIDTNNIIVEDVFAGHSTALDPFTFDESTIDPGWAGLRQLASPAIDPLNPAFAIPAGSILVPKPGSGSSVVGTATGTIAPLDFYGQPRGSQPDQGAVRS